MEKICLFGGTFDPIHVGHVRMAKAAKQACNLDKVLFLPCAASPHKSLGPHSSDAQRCEMIRLALAEHSDWAELNLSDLELPPPSWSWRLAEYFKSLYPKAELFWLMGTDQWDALDRWSRWEYLADMVCFIVYHRNSPPSPRPNVRSVFIPGNEPASSTEIRQALKNKAPSIPYLHPQVADYIKKHRLYL